MGPCAASAESGEQGVFVMSSNGQLKMPLLGNYCVTVSGKGAADTDVAQGADVTATSSNAQHPVEHIAGLECICVPTTQSPSSYSKRGPLVKALGPKDERLHVQDSICRGLRHAAPWFKVQDLWLASLGSEAFGLLQLQG
jgi:hypothetical protein